MVAPAGPPPTIPTSKSVFEPTLETPLTPTRLVGSEPAPPPATLAGGCHRILAMGAGLHPPMDGFDGPVVRPGPGHASLMHRSVHWASGSAAVGRRGRVPGRGSSVAEQAAHNRCVGGSNPPPATIL